MDKFNIGDIVVLTGLPEWLIHDLPLEDQQRMTAQIGQDAIIEKIEPMGYYWLGFDIYKENQKYSAKTGSWFCVTGDFLSKADINSS